MNVIVSLYTLRHISYCAFDCAGSAFYWSAVYPLVHTGCAQVLVRSLPVGRSAGPHFTTACWNRMQLNLNLRYK